MRFFTASAFFTLALFTTDVAAHCLITKVEGANGKVGQNFGISDPTGTKLRLFNQASRYVAGDKSACGSQKLDGKKQFPVDKAKELSKAISAGLPSIAADGTMKLSILQINADGAGPFKCEVSNDASGNNFKEIAVTQQPPGTKGRSNAANKTFGMTIKFPAGTTCTGQSGSCLVRCKNAINQSFGGCFAVTSSGSKAAANNKAKSNAPKTGVSKRAGGSRLDEEEIVARDVEDIVDDDVEEVDTVDEAAAAPDYVPRSVSRVFDARAMEEREASADLAKLFGSTA